MMRTKIRRIGDSLGVIFPKREVARIHLAAGDTADAEVTKKVSLKELFGTIGSGKTGQAIKDETRVGWGP